MPPLSVCDTNISILDNHYSLNDLHKASGGDRKHQPSNFLRVEQTKELIAEIDRSSDLRIAVKVKKGGKEQGTYVCRELVYAYAMWISPKFHLAVIRAFDQMVNDHLAAAGNATQPEVTTPVPAIEYKPLNPQQQIALTKAVRQRAKEANASTAKIYRELRDVFEVHTWKDIPAEKYTQAKALVKSMVLEGELMPRQTTPAYQPQPQPEPRYPEAIHVPVNDWILIANCIRTISQAMDDAWNNQGGRSANNYNNPPPAYIQLPYTIASQTTRAIGTINTHTFAAFGK